MEEVGKGVFDIAAYNNYDFIATNDFLYQTQAAAVLSYIDKLLKSGAYFTNKSPFVIASIGCGDGKFTNNLIKTELESERKYNIKHISKFLIDPYGNKADGIFTFNAKEFSNNFPSNYCDIILCLCCAHLFNNIEQFILNCVQILKPGGMLMIIKGSRENILPWGSDAQYTYDKFGNCKWLDSSELVTDMESPFVRNLHKHCHLTVETLSKHFQVAKTVWKDFIYHQPWSNLRLLNDKQIENSLKFVDTMYPNENEKVKFEYQWFVTKIIKKYQNNQQIQKEIEEEKNHTHLNQHPLSKL